MRQTSAYPLDLKRSETGFPSRLCSAIRQKIKKNNEARISAMEAAPFQNKECFGGFASTRILPM